jgi:uncharacterized protein YodC (DUF2158 family)
MSNKTAFKVGDIVTLKSGGPEMTVNIVGDVHTHKHVGAGNYRCQWFAGKKLDQGTFPFESLVEVETEVEKKNAP